MTGCDHPVERCAVMIRCACGAEKPALDTDDRPITVEALTASPGALVLDAVESGAMTLDEAHALGRELLAYRG